MVDLRECLWRVPVALTHMVDIEERSRASMERCCKVRILILLSTTMKILGWGGVQGQVEGSG